MVCLRQLFRTFRVVFVVIVIVVTRAVPVAAQVVCQDPTSTMLWQVTGAALDSRGITVDLLGSIHVGKADFYPLAPEIESRFQQADALVFEVDPQTVLNPATMLMMQQRGTLPAGQTLDSVVSADTMAMLNATLAKLGIPPQLMGGLRPWMVGLMLEGLQVQALGYQAQYGIESYLMREKPSDAEVLQLETIEEQIAMLEALDAEAFLRYSLKDFENASTAMPQMVDLWRCGDHQRLNEILVPDDLFSPEELAEIEALMDRMIVQRNVTMADGIEQFIKTGSGAYFVVVGSGHLIGEDSIVELLQQRGYTVTPVRKAVQ